jgi:uncharacterized protein YneF (UPF0154 family)
MEISTSSLLIGLILNGIGTGIGVAIGTYIANKHIINTIEKIGGQLKGEKLKQFGEQIGNFTKRETTLSDDKL